MEIALLFIGLIVYSAVGVIGALLTMASGLGLMLMWWLAGLGANQRAAKRFARIQRHRLANGLEPLAGIPIPGVTSTQEQCAPRGITGQTRISGWAVISIIVGILILIAVPTLILIARKR